MDSLLINCKKIIQQVQAAAGENWLRNMPSWVDRGHRRGRLGWGECRDKEYNVHWKKWAERLLCRTAVIHSLDFYFDKVGLPATIAGTSFKKAVMEGRFDLASIQNSPSRGLTRGQMRLVPCLPPNDIDLRSVFVVVFAASYCRYLKVINVLTPHHISTLHIPHHILHTIYPHHTLHTIYPTPYTPHYISHRWMTGQWRLRRSSCLSFRTVC